MAGTAISSSSGVEALAAARQRLTQVASCAARARNSASPCLVARLQQIQFGIDSC
jgi:hypothetical protein